MDWKIWLTGDPIDLNELAKSFNSPTISIFNVDNGYYISGTMFNPIQDINELKKRAAEILLLLNGVTRLGLGGRQPLDIQRYSRINADGHEEAFLFAHDTLRIRDLVSITITHEDGTIEEVNQADVCYKWLSASLKDDSVAKVLRLIALDYTSWVGLYRILEAVDADINVVQAGWATSNAISRFKRTANHPDAAGDEARHGHMTTEPPPKPMSHTEAKSLISFIVNSWLNTKIVSLSQDTL